jgi:signal transduction histidine kinase
MKAPSNKVILDFDQKVFHYGLIVAGCFRLMRTVHEYLTDSPTFIIFLGVFNLLLFFVVFQILKKNFVLAFILFYCQALITSLVTWNNAGGWNGTVPYILIVLTVMIIITSHGLLRLVTLAAYLAFLLLMHFTPVANYFGEINTNYSIVSQEINFLILTSFLWVVTFFLKLNFVGYRSSIEESNFQLTKTSEQLQQQSEQLQQQHAELSVMRNKLEKIIYEKSSEAQAKAEILNEYAFVNAHHVRAPLARVLGLLSLLELENHNSTSEAIDKIKHSALEMDMLIRKINDTIGD